MLIADWLAEHRSVVTTLSSLLLIAGFLIIAARSGKSKKAPGGRQTLPDAGILETQAIPVDDHDDATSDIVALLPSPDTDSASRLSTRPSLFVLPLEGLSETEQDQQTIGELHDEIVTTLSKSSDIAVIGRKAKEWSSVSGRSIRTLGQELNVRYAVSGDIAKRGDVQRLAVHLLETATGGSIWSKNFDLDGSNETSNSVLVNKIAGNVASEILRAEAERTLRQEPGHLSAEDLTHRASHSLTAFNRRTFHEVESLVRLAIDLKPSFPGGYGILAGAMTLKAHQSWTTSPEEDLEEAFSMGSRAVELSPGDPRMLFWWGHVHFYGGRTDDAIGILENAAAKDTSFVPTYILLGAALILAQQPDQGIARIEHALTLSPDHALAFRAQLWLGIGYMEMGNGSAAQKAFLESINRNVIKNPTDSADAFWAWTGMAGVYANLGRPAESRAILDRLRERFVDHDYGIMYDHAQASFAPKLQRLKMIRAIDAHQTSALDQDLPSANGLSSLRDLFRRRATVEGPID